MVKKNIILIKFVFVRLKLMAASLEDTLPPNSEAYQLISSTLDSTSRQLNNLKSIAKRHRRRLQKPQLPTPAVLTKGGGCLAVADRPQTRGFASSWRRRVYRMAGLVNLLLVVVLLLAWAVEPTCCDTYSAISFQPKLRYVNGPPPM